MTDSLPTASCPAEGRNLLSGLSGFACLSLVALSLIGCAQQPPQGGQGVRRNLNTGEYFPEGRYGTASPRVVGDGQVVPRGGGRALVGKPYTIAGRRYVPREFAQGHSQTGRASWYGDAFHGRKTANGEIYDMSAISAAHPTMPLPSYARVTNLGNNRSIIVRVNDRGPYHGGRVIDLSKRVADALDFRRFGTANVKVEYLRPAGIAGSDDRQLLASLRTDGSPAQLDGGSGFGRTMIASAAPETVRAPEPVAQRVAAPSAPTPAAAASPALALSATPRTQPATQQATSPVAAAAFEPEENVTAVARAARGAPSAVPLPPSRPLDLATIPGATVPIAAPPRRPAAQNSPFGTLTFFGPLGARETPAAPALRSPFRAVGTRDVVPLNR